MTTVYLALSGYSDYEGGGDTVLGVYSTEDKALVRLKTEWVNVHGKLLSDFQNDGFGCFTTGEYSWLQLEAKVLDE